jgi:UDP-N-acetylglucosamine 1-carboxyvinyltransferase
MKCIEICRTSGLKGTVSIQGSKNSSLSLMAAACLADSPVFLENIPDISDVYTFFDMLKNMGAAAGFSGPDHVTVDPRGLNSTVIDPVYTRRIRPSYYFIGSLLAKHKKITLGYPGGDQIGRRPIDQHIKGLTQMGAHFEFFNDHYIVTAEELKGCDIYFDLVTGGATLNVMMAAVLAKGTTTIHNAARDPEVVDTAVLLNKMGAGIHGAGTDTVRIDGADVLHGCRHTVIPDRLIAGTYLIAAGIAGGDICVENVIPEHVMPLIFKLEEMGIGFKINENSITAVSDGNVKPARITAEKFPAFETDFQQPISALLLKAKGSSTIEDKVYPGRSNHCSQLIKMGADIVWSGGSAHISGGNVLEGTIVNAEDIRAGTCLVLAGLLAKGKTYITGVEHIERGFSDITKDLSKLGAGISLMELGDGTERFQGACRLKSAAVKF